MHDLLLTGSEALVAEDGRQGSVHIHPLTLANLRPRFHGCLSRVPRATLTP